MSVLVGIIGVFEANPANFCNQSGHTAEDYVRRREEADAGSAKRGMLTTLLRTLASSPADRAWCRHGLVVLCKSRLGPDGVGTILDRLVTMADEELFESSWDSKNGEQMVSFTCSTTRRVDLCRRARLARNYA